MSNNKYKYAIILLSAITFSYLLWHIVHFNNWDSLIDIIINHQGEFYKILLIQIIVLLLNLSLETAKWHYLIRDLHHQKFKISFIQVLGGCSAGVITPGRVGEPAGRLIYIPNGLKIKSVTLAFVGGLIQTIVIGCAGVIAFFFSNPLQTEIENPFTESVILKVTVTLVILITVWGTFRFFKPELILKYYRKIKDSLSLLRRSQLSWVTIFSILRYVCFSAQLILWFLFFNPKIDISSLIILTPIYYLIITLIPSFLFADLGIRGSVAIFVFSLIKINIGHIISVIFCQWIITTCIPALAGSAIYFFIRNNKTIIIKKT